MTDSNTLEPLKRAGKIRIQRHSRLILLTSGRQEGYGGSLYLEILEMSIPIPSFVPSCLLSPACDQRPWSGDCKTPSVRACMSAYVRPSVRSSCFCINFNISFINEDIFTKFARNVYGDENLSLKNFSLILKIKMATLANCLKIVMVL